MDILRNKFVEMRYELPQVILPTALPDILEEAVGEICLERALQGESS